MRLRSIGARLTLWYMGLLAGTLFVLGGAAYILLSFNLHREVDVALNGVATTLAEQAREGAERSYSDLIDQIFRRYFGFSPLDPYFEMLDPSGRPGTTGDQTRRLPLSKKSLENASLGMETFETIEGLSPYPIRVLTRPVVVQGRVISLVQVGMSLERIYQTRKRFLLILITILPVGLALAGVGGWILARHSLKPVDLMTRAARRISAYHLSERLEETGTDDELDRLARTLNETLGRLDESFNQIRQFSADASHELQIPLTVLKGEIEVALRSPRTVEEYESTLQSSLEEIDRMGLLVEGLMLLARADAGVLKIDRQSVHLTELIEEVCDQLAEIATECGVKLEIQSGERVSLVGDPTLLRQLVKNLIHNGIKYTPSGGTVTVFTERQKDWAVLKVSDNGVGVTPEDQEKIFQRFYRSGKARSDSGGGAGLGLSIARSIVEAHQGRIEVDSVPGSGSTFTVRLLLAESSPSH